MKPILEILLAGIFLSPATAESVAILFNSASKTGN